MTQENTDYKKKIEDVLSHYEEGRDIFKNAKDWDHPLIFKPGSENANVPQTWLELVEHVIGIVAHEKYGLKTYANEISIIDYEQMLDLYSSVGIPVGYKHWSFGKERASQDQMYKQGRMGLAYEIVINSNPSIAYCMTQNTPLMQMLVIAHASFGHNSFFKNNHMFRQFTDADEILPMMERFEQDAARYEERYGADEVEKLFDAAHALEAYAVNRYSKPHKRTPEEETARRMRIEEMRRENYDPVLDRTSVKMSSKDAFTKAAHEIPADMEENLVRFIASDAPHLKPWQRNLLTQFADKAQYFYPQKQTQLMNEGWASFWHYTLLTDLREMDLISEGMYLEFLTSHTGVLTQPDFDDKRRYSGINPYALGFAIFRDIRRMCEEPTDEDRKHFPNIVGKPWIPTLMDAMERFKDESFILQFLSPKVARDFKLFCIKDDAEEDEYVVTSIHDDSGFRALREDLASQYRLAERELQIEVAKYNFKGDRALTLQHTMRNGIPIDEGEALETLKHFHYLWGHPVILHSVDQDGTIVSSLSIPYSAKDNGPKPGQKLTYN